MGTQHPTAGSMCLNRPLRARTQLRRIVKPCGILTFRRVFRPSKNLSLRTSAHAGVAIRFPPYFYRRNDPEQDRMVNENSRTLHEDAAGHTRCRATTRAAPTGINEIAMVIVGADAHIRPHGMKYGMNTMKPCGILTFRRVFVKLRDYWLRDFFLP